MSDQASSARAESEGTSPPLEPGHDLVRRGFDLLDQGEDEKALEAFEQAASQAPEYGEAYVGIGRVRYNRRQFREALEEFDRGVGLGPADVGAWSWRGNTWFQLGEPARALADYSEAVRLGPDSFVNHLNRGHALRVLGRFDEAITDYTEALRLQPSRDCRFWRGRALFDKGDYAAALADFNEILQLEPSDVDARAFRAETLSFLREYERAADDFSEAIRLQPGHARFHVRRAFCQARLGLYEEALADLTAAFGFGDRSITLYFQRGQCHDKLGHYDQAVVDFTEVIRQAPDTGVFHASCGLARHNQGDSARAVEDFDRAIALGYPAHAVRGNAYCGLEDWSRALADYREALRRDPDDATSYLNRGHALRWLGEHTAALADYGERIRREPSRGDGYNGRGMVYHQLGQYARALEEYAEALRREPANGAYKLNRGLARYQVGDYQGAAEDLEEAERSGQQSDDLLAYLGMALLRVQDFSGAVRVYEEILRRDPTRDVGFFLAHALHATSDSRAAFEALDSAIGRRPDNVFALFLRARLWLEADEAELALQDLDAALRADPEHAAIRSWRGSVLESLGEYEQAWADFDAAIRHKPDVPDYWEARSRIADGLGRTEEADADFATAERLRSSEAETEGEAMLMDNDRMALYQLVQEHFGSQPLEQIRRTTRFFPPRVWADLQLAADRFGQDGRELVHFSAPQRNNIPVGDFAELYQKDRRNPPAPASPQVEEIDIGEDRPVACLHNGLWLLRSAGVSFAVVLSSLTHRGICFQVAAPAGSEGDRVTHEIFDHLEEAVRRSRCYRGKVLSLEMRESYSGHSSGILVHRLQSVLREQVVLPPVTLGLLDRNVLTFVQRRGRLKELGLASKKGLLFYGPPGTGKTHTLHYLIQALQGHTTFLIAAEQVGLLSDYLTLARLLQPSLVIIEDVDLIARERGSSRSAGEEALLNKLLNEMDGLRTDAEILFVLTTNHPQALEGALASRPGRIDQAIEFPRPDAAGREKLVRLYAERVVVSEEVVRAIVARTDQVTASFIKELMRRATQFALERDDSGRIELQDVNDALDELLNLGGSLNARLLGAHGPFGFVRPE